MANDVNNKWITHWLLGSVSTVLALVFVTLLGIIFSRLSGIDTILAARGERITNLEGRDKVHDLEIETIKKWFEIASTEHRDIVKRLEKRGM